MQISAEIRWFWLNAPPTGLQKWFFDPAIHGCGIGGGIERTDEYLCDATQSELGIKRRGGEPDPASKDLPKVEVKLGLTGLGRDRGRAFRRANRTVDKMDFEPLVLPSNSTLAIPRHSALAIAEIAPVRGA